MNRYILTLNKANGLLHGRIGAKAASLCELMKIETIYVPAGFCVTVEAFEDHLDNIPGAREILHDLSKLTDANQPELVLLTRELRKAIEAAAIPLPVINAVTNAIEQFEEKTAFAIRSSATAEDLPGFSFAGQQESYLNITGIEAVLDHIKKCWASLFTERAVSYRIVNGFNDSGVSLAVIVQQLIPAQKAGVMFTADPVTSNRKIVSIDAGFGLGEALVAGLVDPDNYQVRQNKIIAKKVSRKQFATTLLAAGGTTQSALHVEKQSIPVLSDEEIFGLEKTGRRIEAAFGAPQDIEWCVADDKLYIVQSRPITTLYPIPESTDDQYRVYVSVGHNQMMTDAMKPLGLSVFKLTSRGAMREAGNRLFVDITTQLSSPQSRMQVIEMLGKSHPLIKDALLNIVNRDGLFEPIFTATENAAGSASSANDVQQAALANHVSQFVDELIAENEKLLTELQQEIKKNSGAALVDFIINDLNQRSKTMFDTRGMQVIMAGMNAATWINEKVEEWLGEKNVADYFSQSAPGNVTSEMGLAMLDLADVIRPHKQVLSYLYKTKDERFLEQLDRFEGGAAVGLQLIIFLSNMGCVVWGKLI